MTDWKTLHAPVVYDHTRQIDLPEMIGKKIDDAARCYAMALVHGAHLIAEEMFPDDQEMADRVADRIIEVLKERAK